MFPVLSNRVYDILKIVAQYVLPASVTLVFALASIWGFEAEKIMGTIVAIETFLGILLGLSSAQYKKLQASAPKMVQKGLFGSYTDESGQVTPIFNMPSKIYDALKWVVQYFLPGLGTLYFALAAVWGWPYGEQVLGTISAVDIFLGVLLGLSAAEYKQQVIDERMDAMTK